MTNMLIIVICALFAMPTIAYLWMDRPECMSDEDWLHDEDDA